MQTDTTLENIPLHPRVIEAAHRVNIKDATEILHYSPIELEKKLQLNEKETKQLIKEVSKFIYDLKSRGKTGTELLKSTRFLSTGDKEMDRFLKGGITTHGITEIFGQSGTGKTQLCLTMCLTVQLPEQDGGLDGEVVYLVSEGRFPLKRLYQLIPHFQKKHPILKDKDLGSKIHIAHLADLETQHHLIHYHLPVLLSRHKIRLIILDSVAANFRAEDLLVDGEMKTSKNGFSIEKIRGLLQLGHQLHRLSVNFGIPVICVNQATALMRSEFDLVQTPEDSAIPALGLSWSNTLNTRIMLQRDRSEGLTSDNQRRSLRVLLSPYLSNGSCNFTIEEDGINGEDSGGHMS